MIWRITSGVKIVADCAPCWIASTTRDVFVEKVKQYLNSDGRFRSTGSTGEEESLACQPTRAYEFDGLNTDLPVLVWKCLQCYLPNGGLSWRPSELLCIFTFRFNILFLSQISSANNAVDFKLQVYIVLERVLISPSVDDCPLFRY